MQFETYEKLLIDVWQFLNVRLLERLLPEDSRLPNLLSAFLIHSHLQNRIWTLFACVVLSRNR